MFVNIHLDLQNLILKYLIRFKIQLYNSKSTVNIRQYKYGYGTIMKNFELGAFLELLELKNFSCTFKVKVLKSKVNLKVKGGANFLGSLCM